MKTLLTLLLCCLPLCAQSWESLRGLTPGDRIKVRETAGTEHKGKLASVSADTLVLDDGKGPVTLERTRVGQVQVRSTARRVRKIAIYSAIGLAIGATIDLTLGTRIRNESAEGTGARAATYIAPTAIFGAIAAAMPAYRTVYKAH